MESSYETGSWYAIESISCSREPDLSNNLIAELGIFVPQGGDRQEFDLGVELRCSPLEVEDGRVSFSFRIQRAQLHVLLTNCVIPVGTSRYGDDQPPPTVRRPVKREFETQEEQANTHGVDGTAAAAKEGPQAQLSGKLSKSSRAQHTNRESRTDEVNYWFVRSQTQNRWEIQDPFKGWLWGKYLGDDALCRIKSHQGPFEIKVQLNAKPRDFDVDDIRGKQWFSRLSKTKQKLIKRALSKIHFTQEEGGKSYVLGLVNMRSNKRDGL